MNQPNENSQSKDGKHSRANRPFVMREQIRQQNANQTLIAGSSRVHADSEQQPEDAPNLRALLAKDATGQPTPHGPRCFRFVHYAPILSLSRSTLPVANCMIASSVSSPRVNSPVMRPSCITSARSARPKISSISLDANKMATP